MFELNFQKENFIHVKKEVLELLKEIEDDAEIDSLLQSTDLFKSASDKNLQ